MDAFRNVSALFSCFRGKQIREKTFVVQVGKKDIGPVQLFLLLYGTILDIRARI